MKSKNIKFGVIIILIMSCSVFARAMEEKQQELKEDVKQNVSLKSGVASAKRFKLKDNVEEKLYSFIVNKIILNEDDISFFAFFSVTKFTPNWYQEGENKKEIVDMFIEKLFELDFSFDINKEKMYSFFKNFVVERYGKGPFFKGCWIRFTFAVAYLFLALALDRANEKIWPSQGKKKISEEDKKKKSSYFTSFDYFFSDKKDNKESGKEDSKEEKERKNKYFLGQDCFVFSKSGYILNILHRCFVDVLYDNIDKIIEVIKFLRDEEEKRTTPQWIEDISYVEPEKFSDTQSVAKKFIKQLEYLIFLKEDVNDGRPYNACLEDLAELCEFYHEESLKA